MGLNKRTYENGRTVITGENMNDIQDAIIELEESLRFHTDDQNDPHHVTAEQVGARPNTWMPTAEEVGAHPNTWVPTPSQVGARPDTWLPTIAEIGAAPAGYGLGTEVVSLGHESVDNITGNGFYFGYVGLPEVLGNSFILHLDYGGYCQQLVFSLTATTGYGNLFIRREKNGGIWGEWEWETPLMRPGVEYRTTERWNNEPVYTMAINFGALPNNGLRTVSDIVNADAEDIRIDGVLTDGTGYCRPLWALIHDAFAFCNHTSAGFVAIETNRDLSMWNATITLKYVVR